MARKFRLILVSVAGLLVAVVASLWVAYVAVHQVRPFYHEALELDPVVLEAGSRELESRASALYSDTREAGEWHAQFTDEQINGWLATQLEKRMSESGDDVAQRVSDPRVAIGPDVLTLGFRAFQGGIATVVTVDATVSLTEEGAIAIQLKSVRAGALPLPVAQVADEIAQGCRQLGLPVRWLQSEGEPIAIVEIGNEVSSDKRRLSIDAIELHEGELYVAGHTDIDNGSLSHPDVVGPLEPEARLGNRPRSEAERKDAGSVEVTGYELRLAPTGRATALEIARRAHPANDSPTAAPKSSPSISPPER